MRKILMTMLAGLIGSMALAAEFFVDAKNGDDANAGTEQLPVRSLARAAELASGSADAAVRVTVLPGCYGEDAGTDVTMTYTSKNGATANYRVVLATGSSKTVTFKARDGKAVTHIVGKKSATVTDKDGRGDDAIAGVRNDNVDGLIFDGFTIRGCYGPMTSTDQIDRGAGAVSVTLVDCVISNCCASIGSAAYGGVLHRCRVTGNKAASGSSSIVQASSLSNCLVDNNAGTTLTYCKQIVNCTVCGNTVGHPFGGVSGSTMIYNTLAFGNAKSNGHGSNSETYPYEFINSVAVAPAVFPTVTGSVTDAVGNQCVSPDFGDFRLLPSSPAVGIGTVEGLKEVGLPAGYTEYRDYNGNLIDISDPTAKINAGCVQEVAVLTGATMVFKTAFEVEGLGTVPANGSFVPTRRQYRVRPLLDSGNTAYAIKVAEETSSKIDYLRHALMDGWTPVVPNPDVSATMTFSVVDATGVYYVDPAGDDANDGLSPTSGADNVGPKKTISGALAVAPDYAIVRVARGVYGTEENSGEALSRILIDKNVGLISSDGIGAAKIVGASDSGTFGPNAKRCVHITSIYGFVQGFVLADGYSDNQNTDAYRGAGVSSSTVNPQILDCTITNCHAKQAGALYRGTVLRSKIIGCSASGGYLTYVTALGTCILADNSLTTNDKWAGDKSSAFACTMDIPSGEALPYMASTAAFVGNIVRGGDRPSTDPTVLAANVMDEDPLFCKASTYDFRLGVGTPAVGQLTAEDLAIADAYRYVTTDVNGDPLVFTEEKMTAGAVHNNPLLPTVVILADNGGVTVTGAAVGTNVVETTAEVTIAATDATRPFLGFEVDGVMRPASETEVTLSGFDAGTQTHVRAIYGTTWYVSKTGDDSRSGGTPETAKKTIRAAAALAIAGDTIKVGPGVYGEEDGTMRQASPVLSGEVDIDCRVWVKEGVTLESTDGAEETVIVGRRATSPLDAYGNGTDAVRCVVLAENATVKGFTLTGGATGYDEPMDKVVYTDHNCAGGVLGTAAASSQVVDCIVSNNVATTSAAGHNVRFVRSRILENTVVQRAVARSCCFAGSVIDRNRGDICIEFFGEFDSSTIGPNNLKLNGGAKPSMLRYPNGLPTLRNSVVMASLVNLHNDLNNANYKCNISNCVFAAGCGLTHATMQQYGLGDDFDLVDVATIGVDDELRPIPDSASVLLDHGDDFSCDDVKADWDASGVQRIMNGGRDIGALEGDWRDVYARDIGRRVKVVSVRPDVYEDVADGKVTIPSGEGLQLELSNPVTGETTCELTLRVLSGTLALALDGTDLEPVAASAEPVTRKLVLSPGAHVLSLAMSSADGDLAKVVGYRRNIGMCLIVR